MSKQILRLSVVSGPAKGQLAFVPSDSTIIVGRLPECGLSFPQDVSVSRQHFRIEVHGKTCRLSHLSQTGPTIVNGVSVSEIDLKKDDEISFGQDNCVQVTFEESRDHLAAPTARTEASATPSNAFTIAKASCGWNLYESPSEQPDFAKLLDCLCGMKRMSAIIDFGRIGTPVLPELNDSEFLLSWLKPPVRDERSPLLTLVSPNSAVAEIIKSTWGKDGVVCFGSDLKEAELAAHWRKAVGVSNDQPSSAMTAYFWPSILDLILTCQSSEQAAPLLGRLSWLFFESPKSPGKWHLFSKADFVADLTEWGLVPAPESSKIKMNHHLLSHQLRRIKMPPAARITDMHVCPMVTPAVVPIPHVGGPIVVGCPTVMVGMMPAARVGDMMVCVGPPDVIAMGSFTVLIGGQPAARLGDMTAHGGTVVVGCPTVMIG